eukprot:1115-Eustigmatos_ZCMA.PRE.1
MGGGMHHFNNQWWGLKHGDPPVVTGDISTPATSWTAITTRSNQPHSQYNGNVIFPFAKKDSQFCGGQWHHKHRRH